MKDEAVYVETFRKGLLKKKILGAYEMLEACELCPRKCGADRLSGETGVCRTGKDAWVSSYNPHFGEETPLSGSSGSGTIFFTHCNLLCIFCQNYDISHGGCGQAVSNDQLAEIMLSLQRSGCHNINFVSPSHVVPQMLAALEIATDRGLSLPLVYNTGAYDRVETLRLLEGVIDIYMPDFKFWNPEIAKTACDAPDYPEVARQALVEMHRQVGDLITDASGIATRGLLIRHLVLPHGLAGTRDVMRFIAQQLSPDSYVNIMPQYRPCGRAAEISALAGHPSSEEFQVALQEATEEGITRLDQRPRFVFMM